MVNKRTDEFSAIGATLAAGDLILVQDVSDTTDRAEGTTKKATRADIVLTAAEVAAMAAVAANTAKVTYPSADSTKLAGIESAATADQTDGEIQIAAAKVIAAKGDLQVGSAANTNTILGAGTAGQVLTIDSAQTTGMKWATPASGGGSSTEYVVLNGSGPASGSGGSVQKKLFGIVNVAGAVTAISVAIQGTTSSDATNNIDFAVKNYNNSGLDMLAAAYNTNTDGDITKGTDTDLGTVNATTANVTVAVGDMIELWYTMNGTSPSNLFGNDIWVKLTITPS